MLMQVLQLTPEQLNSLPPKEREREGGRGKREEMLGRVDARRVALENPSGCVGTDHDHEHNLDNERPLFL